MVLMEDHHTDTNVPSPHDSPELAGTSTCSEKTSKKKTQQRTCIATREVSDKADLLRFVCDRSGQIYFDLTHKLPGRGIYVSTKEDALKQAISKNLFAKAAKRQVRVPDDLLHQIEVQLRQSLLNLIGLSRRAGDLIISADKINKFIKSNEIECYITASCEGSDSRCEIERQIGACRVILDFSSEELSDVLGLENAVHLAMKKGGLSQKFLKQLDVLHNLSTASTKNRK